MVDTGAQVVVYQNFQGGLNTKLHPTQISANQAVLLQNIDHSIPGKLTTRNGYTQAGNTPVTTNGQIQGFFDFAPEGGTHVLIGFDNNVTAQRIWSWTGSGNWTDRGAFAAFINQKEIVAVQFNNLLYFADGTNVSGVMDSGLSLFPFGLTNLDFPQAISILAVWSGRIWASTGIDGKILYSDPLRAHTSALGSPTTGGWDRTNQVVTVGVGTGEKVVAIVPLRNEALIAFTNQSIYQLVIERNIFGVGAFGIPVDIPRPVQVSDTIGCGSRKSVALVGGDMIFMDQYGRIRSLKRTIADESQGVENIPLSDPVSGTIPKDLNLAEKSKCLGIYFDGKYHFSYPSGPASENDKTLIFDASLQSWTGPFSYGMRRAVVSAVTGVEKLYFSKDDSANFKVYSALDGTSDNGTAIEFKLNTKRENFGFLDRKKTGQYVLVACEEGALATLDVSVSVDGGGFLSLGSGISTSLGTLPIKLPIFIGGGNIISKTFDLSEQGEWNDIQVELSSDDLSELVSVFYVIVAANVRDPELVTREEDL